MELVSIIGYSGHSYVVIDCLESRGYRIDGYFDQQEKFKNPFDIKYLGQENTNILENKRWFVAIGHNAKRKRIIEKYRLTGELLTVIHNNTTIGSHVSIESGTLVSSQVAINAMTNIGIGCIINTNATVEHECTIGNYTHVAPGASLAGNVRVGDETFIGANAVIRQGLQIGNNAVIGAGAVVIREVPDNATVVGNPGRIIKIKE